jgi:ribosomal protein L7Ae-like RNA K-turn-binding protein
MCVEVDSKEELGAAAGIGIPTSAVAIVEEGDAKTLLKELKATFASANPAVSEAN